MAVSLFCFIIFYSFLEKVEKMARTKSLIDHFLIVTDPRINRTKKHNLIDIIVIAVCGVICSCETWVDIEEYGYSKEEWFKKFLELPGGIPSHDTFGRVFSLIDPIEFQKAFYEWTKSVIKITEGEVISMDGKYFRSSLTKKGDPRSVIGMVSAWASKAGVALAQKKADFKKSGEKQIYRDLIDILDLKGCIVTMDAYGCHADITNRIIEKEGHFVVGLKRNQRLIYDEAVMLFKSKKKIKSCETIDKSHGRVERRVCRSLKFDMELLDIENRHAIKRIKAWTGIKSVTEIFSERTLNGKTSQQARYYISSLPPDPVKLLETIRSHWGVENKLHYVLDVAFDEDHSRIRIGHAGENMAVLRRLALNLLRQEKTSKRSINGKRLKCSWTEDYLLKVIKGMSLDHLQN